MARTVQGRSGNFANTNGNIRQSADTVINQININTNLALVQANIIVNGNVRLDNQGAFDLNGIIYHNLQLQTGSVSIAGVHLDAALPMNANTVLNIQNAFTRSLADAHFYSVVP